MRGGLRMEQQIPSILDQTRGAAFGSNVNAKQILFPPRTKADKVHSHR